MVLLRGNLVLWAVEGLPHFTSGDSSVGLFLSISSSKYQNYHTAAKPNAPYFHYCDTSYFIGVLAKSNAVLCAASLGCILHYFWLHHVEAVILLWRRPRKAAQATSAQQQGIETYLRNTTTHNERFLCYLLQLFLWKRLTRSRCGVAFAFNQRLVHTYGGRPFTFEARTSAHRLAERLATPVTARHKSRPPQDTVYTLFPFPVCGVCTTIYEAYTRSISARS